MGLQEFLGGFFIFFRSKRPLLSSGKVEYKADQNNFVVIFYRHCGEGWGWSADQSDISSANDSQNGIRNGTRKDEYEEAV